ncbi:MAG TPA: TfoX/Sxy family protein [Flavisolibacter sp.]|nr:TfoX/Sxy family protein [Flavisolibacter sp.]
MPYNEKLAALVRKALAHLPNVEEKRMFSGLAFLVNDKMCVNVSGDELMCRFDPALHDSLYQKNGFRTMIMKGKELKGYGYVNEEVLKSEKEFAYWINLCLAFNSVAKSSKKTPAKKKKTVQ